MALIEGVNSSPQVGVDLSPKNYADANVGAGGVATGSIAMFVGLAAPLGYLLCDGSSVSTSTYSVLFSKIGYTFGGSGGSFNLPNFKAKMPIGIFTTGGGSTTPGSGNVTSLGQTGGAVDHVHTMGDHQHTQSHTHTTSHEHDMSHNHSISHGHTIGHTHTMDHQHNVTGHGHYISLGWSPGSHSHTYVSRDGSTTGTSGMRGSDNTTTALTYNNATNQVNWTTLSWNGSIGNGSYDGSSIFITNYMSNGGVTGQADAASNTISLTSTGTYNASNGNSYTYGNSSPTSEPYASNTGNMTAGANLGALAATASNPPMFVTNFIIKT